MYREARPVYGHPISSVWLATGRRIGDELTAAGVQWNAINPLAYANEGEATPFCPLIISIGVVPDSLDYDAATDAAVVVKRVLTEVNFGHIEVAFVEMVVHRAASTSPSTTTITNHLLTLDPAVDDLLNLRKPFTPTLGLAIATRKHPTYEGTGGLFLRIGGASENRVSLLTCAHVVRPPSLYRNREISSQDGHRMGDVLALGVNGYDKAVEGIMSVTADSVLEIQSCTRQLERLGEPSAGDSPALTKRRDNLRQRMAKAEDVCNGLKSLWKDVTACSITLNQRVIGAVVYSDNIEFGSGPHSFTNDWALIELYGSRIDWEHFLGNKLFVGDIPISTYTRLMWPHSDDRLKDLSPPDDGLLHISGVVQADELRNPQDLAANGDKCLFAVKNGLATGTTFGRVNGLESFVRSTGAGGVSVEVAILPYDRVRAPFSRPGDSGSIVLTRDGRIIGLLTGGGGLTDSAAITYVTPYWWLEQKIKAKFPGASLF